MVPSDYLRNHGVQVSWSDCSERLLRETAKLSSNSRVMLESGMLSEANASSLTFTKKCSTVYLPKKWNFNAFVVEKCHTTNRTVLIKGGLSPIRTLNEGDLIQIYDASKALVYTSEIIRIINRTLVQLESIKSDVCSTVSINNHHVILFKLSNTVQIEMKSMFSSGNSLTLFRNAHALSVGEHISMSYITKHIERRHFPYVVKDVVSHDVFELYRQLNCLSRPSNSNISVTYSQTIPLIRRISVRNHLAVVELFPPGMRFNAMRKGGKFFIKGNLHEKLNRIHTVHSGSSYHISHILVQSNFAIGYLQYPGIFCHRYLLGFQQKVEG